MTSRSRRKHRTTAPTTAVRTAISHAPANNISNAGKLKATFIASLGILLSFGTSAVSSAQIGSGVQAQPSQAVYQAQQHQSAQASSNADRSQAGRSQRSAGRGTLSTALFGSRNYQQQAPATAQRPQNTGQPNYAAQQQPRATAPAPIGPAQVYQQAVSYAMNAGYSPAQAQAYGQQMVQQFQARQLAAQQARVAMAAGQQPAAVHSSMMHQHAEQQRVRMAHQQAAAQQNARLMQAVQGKQMQQYQAYQNYQHDLALRQQAEMAAVRAASLKVAQDFARQSNAMMQPSAAPIAASDEITAEVLPSQYSQRVQQQPETSVLTTDELALEEPAPEMGQPVPEDFEWEMPAEVKQLPEDGPNPLRRTPRRLPAVNPEPLPKQPQPQPKTQEPTELQLEGFSGTNTTHQDIQTVSYQQGAGQSYGAQDYAPEMVIGEELDSQAPEFYEQQLQVSPPQMTYAEPAKKFAVETEATTQYGGDPLFQEAADQNASWDSQEPVAVQPPTGIRARAVSTHVGPGHSRTRAGFPMASSQDSTADGLNLTPAGTSSVQEDLPAPRAYDRDLFSRGSTVRSCDQLRDELLSNSIRSIDLDLSTPLNSVVMSDDDQQQIREWRNPAGEVIATGRAVSATRYGVNIVDENGLTRTLSLATLSGTDQKHAWDLMDLPFECDLVASNILNHNFTPSTVTWYASALCHKPLYFEDIQLERYGHTKGPIRQPVRSAARFLGQAALLPYQLSLHSPNECQYALGYYRPGNCAPYLRTPFPWERRAVGYEAAALAGVFLLIP